jgi:YrbI family 3-deoxy-D-manno-octulosonate 8-phosphate phosphatase
MADIDYAKIDTLVLDVDGVLTDGRIVLAPSGEELKVFHVRDESGMKYWKRAGGKLAIISGRGSPVVIQRARELHVDAVRVHVRDKLPALREVLAELGSAPESTCAIGDDLTDVPVLRECALAVAVADAVAETRQVADYVTTAGGGAGCVREVIELILKRSGRWEGILARYFPPVAPAAEVQG